jgi:uncharacterized protein YqgC (DUF456 family)
LNIIKVILAVLVIVLSCYGLLNPNMNLGPITMLFLGALLLTMGADEIKKEKKAIGYLLIVIGLFDLFVSVKGFL